MVQTSDLTFQDPPDRDIEVSSDLDQDWNGTWPMIFVDINSDPAWDEFKISSGMASEWEFISSPLMKSDLDPKRDRTLKAFAAKYRELERTRLRKQSFEDWKISRTVIEQEL